MPKKGVGGQSGSQAKPKKAKDTLASGPKEDDSFIIFSNSKTKTKAEKAIEKGPGTSEKDSTRNDGIPTEGEVKKPTTKQLVGGSSWTGKLPSTVKSRNGRGQIIRWYTFISSSSTIVAKKLILEWQRKEGQSFSSMVTIKATNPKTKEVVTLPPFKLPPDRKELALEPTAVEARNFAATYALFRVCSMRNIHMMLPPKYRDLWKIQFAEMKKADSAEGREWMYDADPFLSLKERDESKAVKAKAREKREVQVAKEAATPGGVKLTGNNKSGLMKGWTKAPQIEIGRKTRIRTETLILQRVIWNPNGIVLPKERQFAIVNELSSLGFRRSHVEEAVTLCKDREEALEWLLIHVPEDDLPPWSLPEGYVAGISMASGNLKREGALQRLSAVGYSHDLCEKAYSLHNENEQKALEALQSLLLAGSVDNPSLSLYNLAIHSKQEEAPTLWEEEQMILESIYGSRYHGSEERCSISLNIPEFSYTLTLRVGKPLSRLYPESPPIISVASEPKLPAYIRLSIIRQAASFAFSDLLGEQMIFSLVEWLEANVLGIVERPSLLTDITNAVSPMIKDTKERIRSRPNRRQRTRPQLKQAEISETSLRLLKAWSERQSTSAQARMLKVRQSLPAWHLKEQIVQSVRKYQVTIISGETGSGKSTQSVQFVLDDLIQRKLGGTANLICTQPRRISALGLADRVSEERCTPVGTEVGYSIRGESKISYGTTMITFVTTGVLLRRLQTSGGHINDVVAALTDVSHVVIDEVHERSLDTDFLLVLLRDVLKRRADLKVILMSATLDAKAFVDYFGGPGNVGQVEIQGRTFPVEDYYLDNILQMTNFTPHISSRQDRNHLDETEETRGMDLSLAKKIQSLGGAGVNYELLTQIIRTIDASLGTQSGGILVFLPGTMEISRAIDAIKTTPSMYALPLHASLLPAEQKRVFHEPPLGRRKVIIATNVAETSITIPDIVAVIDSGRVKETSFDPASSMVKLSEVWASRAACKQRRGRAGRVAAGKCYKLYTRHAEATKMPERPEPEIRRVPLEQLCLAVKAMGIDDVPAFLSQALSPPDSLAVHGALTLLRRMDALDGTELTALGRHLSMIPADLRLAKLLVYGSLFSCIDACLTIAAILTVRSPFNSPPTARAEAKVARTKFAQGSDGDLLTDLRAYDEWSAYKASHSQRDVRSWCDEHFLAQHTLWDIASNREQYISTLRDTGFLPYGRGALAEASVQNDNTALLRAIIAGAFAPQIARIVLPDAKYAASVSGSIALDPEARTIKYFGQDERVFVHPSSTLFDAQSFSGGSAFVAYFGKMATSKVFIRDLTKFNSMSLLLFGGPIELDTLGRGIVIDGWLRIKGWARIGALISRLRGILDDVLAEMIDRPGVLTKPADEVVALVRHLVEYNGFDR
ncbi:MAG: hypothetical protein M1814_006158 [Vezdaea aestivalis]|nr:MAG: hypothetical protein M1814_006158 [Vezdaea aestivalis]